MTANLGFSFTLVSDQSLIGLGVGRLRWKFPKLAHEAGAHRVGPECPARQPRPLDRALIHCSRVPRLSQKATTYPAGRNRLVGHDEADA